MSKKLVSGDDEQRRQQVRTARFQSGLGPEEETEERPATQRLRRLRDSEHAETPGEP
jgi:hypothetical protein